jgi:putative FmdB family regulatory protein
MPIYEYECDACGHRMEAIQRIDDSPLTQCPECKAETLRKLVSAAGFRLKGTGWYATDFRDKDKPKKSTASSGDKSAAKSDSGTTESASKESSTSTAATPTTASTD